MFFKKILHWFPTFLIIAFLSFSLFFPQGNKFDTGKKISLTLGFGILSLVIFLFSLVARHWNENKKLSFEVRGYSQIIFSQTFLPLLFLTGYVVWTLFSFLFSETQNFGFTEVLMLCGCALFFLSHRGIFHQRALYIFSQCILIFSALLGFILFLSSHHERAFGLFYDPQTKSDAWPNAFAFFVILLWPLFFHFFREKKYRGAKIIGLALIFTTFALTFSRAGMLVGLLQILAFGIYECVMWFRNSRPKISWIPLVEIVAIVMLSLIFIQGAQYTRTHLLQKSTISFSDKATFAKGENVTSGQERFDFWKGAIKLSLQKPVFGYGPMSFGFVYRSIQKDWLAISDHPHNIFLKIAAENGIPAMLFFFLFLCSIAWKVLVNFKKLDRQKQFLLFTLCVAIAGGITHNLVDYNFNFATNFVIFWMLLIFIDEFSKTESRTNSRHFQIFASVMVFFITMGLTIFQISNDFSRIVLVRKGVNDASSYFTIYKQSLFPRYSLLEQGSWADQNGNPELAEKYFLLHLQKNRWDAFAYNRLGNFYRAHGNFEKALTNFKMAVQLDPKNSWNYYLDELQMLVKLDKNGEILAFADQTLPELQQYLPKVKGNLHYTAQSQNAKDALHILQVLNKFDDKNKVILERAGDVILQSIAKYNPL